MCLLNCLQCFDDTEFFHGLADPRPAADPGSINDLIPLPVALEWRDHAVAGCARQIAGQHPFFAQQPVDQRRFADIRPPDHRQLDHVLRSIRLTIVIGFIRPWQRRQHRLHQRFNAFIVNGGDDMQMGQTERVKVGAEQVRIAVFALVDDQMQRFPGAAQLTGDFLIRRRQSGPAIDQ